MRATITAALAAFAITLGGCAYESLQSDREQAQAARDQAAEIRNDAARERDEIDAALDTVDANSAAAEALRAERERIQAILVAADASAQELEQAIALIDKAIEDAQADRGFAADVLDSLAPLIPGGAVVAGLGGYWLRRRGQEIGARDVTESIRVARARSQELDDAFNSLNPETKELMMNKVPEFIERVIKRYKAR